MFNARKFLTIVLFISTGILIGYVIGLIAAKKAHNNEYANSSLFTLSFAIDGLLEQAESGFPNIEARKSLEIIALSEIVIVAQLNPELNHLSGTPIEALCKAIYYHENFKFGNHGALELAKLVSTYLSSMKEEVVVKLQNSIAVGSCPLLNE